MKLCYFLQEAADADDLKLAAAIKEGKVPSSCLLGGPVVMLAVAAGRDPCSGCNGLRERCKGREKQEDSNAGSGIVRDLLVEGLGAPASKLKLF